MRLSIWVIHMNVIGPVCVISHDCTLFASVLVSLFHCVRVPISPVDPVLKQGNGKHMGKCTGHGPVSVLPIHICKAGRFNSIGSVQALELLRCKLK